MKNLLAIPLLLCASLAWSQSPTTGTITASGSSCAINLQASNCVVLPLPAFSSTVGVSILGTYSATLQFEVSADFGASWVSATAIPQPVAAGVTSTTSTGTWQVNVAGMSHVRIRGSAYTSGTASISLSAASGIGISPAVPSTGASSAGVQGATAPGTADVSTTNPVQVGGIDVNNNVRKLQTSTTGILAVYGNASGTDGASNAIEAVPAMGGSSTLGRGASDPYIFNGVTWDRVSYGPTTTTSSAVTTATTTLLHTGVASKKFRIYNLLLSQNGANGGTVQLVEGTGATCGTGTVNLGPIIPLGANTLSNDIVAINFGNSPLTVATAADSVCFTTTVGAASSIVVSDQTANY